VPIWPNALDEKHSYPKRAPNPQTSSLNLPLLEFMMALHGKGG
jgi:hypothetical protein